MKGERASGKGEAHSPTGFQAGLPQTEGHPRSGAIERDTNNGIGPSMNGRDMSHTVTTSGARRRVAAFCAVAMAGTMLGGVPAFAQEVVGEAAPAATTSILPQEQVIRTVTVVGNQRLEADTILSYIQLRPGQVYTAAVADQALKDLSATELFADYRITNNNGNVVIEVVENPIINRIVLEGNSKIKDDKILPEIRLAPRQIYTRSKVRADVARIIELYKRQGRYAAVVEPKAVQLEQNRVDIVFEITEGPKSKVRQINIIGNEAFSDSEIRSEMATKQSRWFRFLSSNTTYDPDRLAFDQQNLRRFYLTEGYADFRVVSAVAELTPDKEDFIITYVVEEGERYRFGDVSVDSQLRDFSDEALTRGLSMKTGDWYDAKAVEDTVEGLTEAAGTFGYAFAEVNPRFSKNSENLTMDVEFVIQEAPRVYVERVDINGNTLTQDKVIRREFRIAEGDAFNSLALARSTARINSLGYFQENFEIEQQPGSAPDRIVLAANVQEQPTGQLQFAAGFSSLESFILQGSIRQVNFRGRGQTVGASINYSRYSRSASLSFFEPYLFNKSISAGIDLYRRDLNNFNTFSRDRTTTFEQTTTGGQLRLGIPITEYISGIARYTLNFEDVFIDEDRYFADFDGDGIETCQPLLGSRYLCDLIGERTSSILGLSLNYNQLNNGIRPTSGQAGSVSLDFAGLGGNVKYIRGRANARKYWNVGSGFIFSLSAEGGYIKGLEERDDPFVDPVRLTDRFQLGEPQLRGFDIRGVGPRVIRQPIVAGEDGEPVIITDQENVRGDPLGGNAYYLGRAELEIPLSSGARELGLRPTVYVDIGSLFDVTQPELLSSPLGNEIFIASRDDAGNPIYRQVNDPDDVTDDVLLAIPEGDPIPDGFSAEGRSFPAFREVFLGNSAQPRISIGVGVNWNSPFGPLRIDFAHALLSQEGDDVKAFSFNVGTQF